MILLRCSFSNHCPKKSWGGGILGNRQLLASGAETTSFYVRGLVMLTFDDPNYLRIVIPEAHGHKATLSIVPNEGDQRTLSIEGHGALV